MKLITVLLAALLLSGCTVSSYVKDVRKNQDGSLSIERCDLTVYLAFYGLIAKPTDCKISTI
jgi:PBP1b-binding outer membrane lipoprotein LpoB